MKWTDELAEDWDDVPADPPRVARDEVAIRWTDDGFVLAPVATGGDSREAASLRSTVACKVGNDPADRDRGPVEPSAETESVDGPESAEL